MKASYNWLKEYVDVNIDPRKLASILTMAGCNVASSQSADGDYIFEFEITANRPDCLSIIGLAREVAAILGKGLKMPKELRKTAKLKAGPKEPSFNILLKSRDLCPRYTARIIRGVEVEPSPDWLKKRIISAGLRPVNNIVDITNFVLFETGQPLHAFDLDRIKGALSVRRAARGEKIVTIDNVPRACDGDMLVIADEKNPIAIAGVMGGLETEVNNMTRNILIESAFFDPISVRKTSRALGLLSESSYRFERKVDEGMVLKASDRASALIAEIAGGKIGPVVDVGRKKPTAKIIHFDWEKANSLLGVSIEKKKAAKILKSLAFSVDEKKGSAKVKVPSFRKDVTSSVDLAEEIARIYGYEKIPVTIPAIIGNTRMKDFSGIFEDTIKEKLSRMGLNEIITYSLVSKNTVKGLKIEDELVAIKNPLTIDQEVMRPSLLPGMLKAISHNFKRYAKRLAFFEIGKVYKEKKNAYIEENILSMAVAGIKHENWKNQAAHFGFFDIKGIFEKFLRGLGLGEEVLFERCEFAGLDARIAAVAKYNGKVIAHLGEVEREVCEEFDIEKKVFYGEIYMDSLGKTVHLDKTYIPYGRYPSTSRDISVILDKGVSSHEVMAIIKGIGRSLVKKVSLVDLYKGKQVPGTKRALLYRIEYRSDEKTLEDAEVEKLHVEIKNTLSEKLNVSFR